MTIANGLILTAKDKRLNLHTAYIKATYDNLSIYKFNIAPKKWLFIFADGSALLYDTANDSMIACNDSFHHLLKWLRENDAE